MSQIPANQKLWVMYVAQAKARYHSWPSPTAAKWVHDHYVQAGGKFVGSEHDVDDRYRDERYSRNREEKGSVGKKKPPKTKKSEKDK